jgi:hypothetical protein
MFAELGHIWATILAGVASPVPTCHADPGFGPTVLRRARRSTEGGGLRPIREWGCCPDAGHGFVFQDERQWLATIDRFVGPRP